MPKHLPSSTLRSSSSPFFLVLILWGCIGNCTLYVSYSSMLFAKEFIVDFCLEKLFVFWVYPWEGGSRKILASFTINRHWKQLLLPSSQIQISFSLSLCQICFINIVILLCSFFFTRFALILTSQMVNLYYRMIAWLSWHIFLHFL